MPGIQTITNIPELFELILLLLDMRTLLTSTQRVCKAWHETINSSPRIQQYLFLSPAPVTAATTSGGVVLRRRQINPLLKEYFPALFQHASQLPHVSARGQLPDDVSDKERAAFLQDYSLLHGHVAFMEMPLYKLRKRKNNWFRRDGATWKKMLVAQPPFTSIGFYEPQNVPDPGQEEGWELQSCSVVQFGTHFEGRQVPHIDDNTNDYNNGVLRENHDELGATIGGLRMDELYSHVCKHVITQPMYFEVLLGVQDVPRADFVSRASLAWRSDEHQKDANFDGLWNLYNQGADVLVQLYQHNKALVGDFIPLELEGAFRCNN